MLCARVIDVDLYSISKELKNEKGVAEYNEDDILGMTHLLPIHETLLSTNPA